ncbi:hypothetical protein Moror_2494 [Moniliophthora roreri MCA 2997]|uniref:Uncharacterized protein n=1 Tax=Moniliophthora roreri (strain MCA 2997) TaxID=1381753 RepID=V2WZX1_MONRO|nr:hypothetical protein Moror_2494 [Moniliophthora roreri MCA 2997]
MTTLFTFHLWTYVFSHLSYWLEVRVTENEQTVKEVKIHDSRSKNLAGKVSIAIIDSWPVRITMKIDIIRAFVSNSLLRRWSIFSLPEVTNHLIF